MTPESNKRPPNVVITIDDNGNGQWRPGEIEELSDWLQEGLKGIEEDRPTNEQDKKPLLQ